MTVGEALAFAARALAGIEGAALDARLLLQHATGWPARASVGPWSERWRPTRLRRAVHASTSRPANAAMASASWASALDPSQNSSDPAIAPRSSDMAEKRMLPSSITVASSRAAMSSSTPSM